MVAGMFTGLLLGVNFHELKRQGIFGKIVDVAAIIQTQTLIVVDLVSKVILQLLGALAHP